MIEIDSAGAKIHDLVNTAHALAKQSPLYLRHGAVCYRGSKIIGEGYNTTRPARWSWSGHKKEITISDIHYRNVHAEVSCMHNVDNLEGSDILVVRVGRRGELRYSRPCTYCQKTLIDKGIRKVIYSIDSNSLGVMKVRELTPA